MGRWKQLSNEWTEVKRNQSNLNLYERYLNCSRHLMFYFIVEHTTEEDSSASYTSVVPPSVLCHYLVCCWQWWACGYEGSGGSIYNVEECKNTVYFAGGSWSALRMHYSVCFVVQFWKIPIYRTPRQITMFSHHVTAYFRSLRMTVSCSSPVSPVIQGKFV